MSKVFAGGTPALPNQAYADAGVDIRAGYRAVELIKNHVRGTFTPGVLSDIGGFGGMYSLARIKDMDDPVMVSGTDGVGTKLAVALMMDKHDTVGVDLVAMCVNDIVCCGAEPLFFLDYIACGKNMPERVEQIVKGVAEGCKMAGAALVGGETAEHPGTMPPEEYDLAGFACGIADRKNIISGETIKEDDALIGIASSGVHSNGFSLIRKALSIDKEKLNKHIDELGMTLGEALLTPTRIYVKPVLSLIKAVEVKGISHITGGGFYENIPRILPEGLAARVNTGSFPVPPIFGLIRRAGNIGRDDMYNTFNMGVGMVICAARENAGKVCAKLAEMGEKAYIIGNVTQGNGLCLE